MFPNNLYVKKYTVSLETINHNLHKNDNEIKESYSPQGTELVVANIEYNVDSVGLINNELNSFVIRENNTLRFLEEAPKFNPDLIELNFQQYIGTTFASVPADLKSLLTEGFVDTQNNVIFRFLGHTTDSFYFYVENDIDRIITYCEKDVIAVAQIFLRLRREELLVKDEIIHV